MNARNYFIFIMLFIIYLTSWHCSYFLVPVSVICIYVFAVSGPGMPLNRLKLAQLAAPSFCMHIVWHGVARHYIHSIA